MSSKRIKQLHSALRLKELVKKEIKFIGSRIEAYKSEIEPIQKEMSDDLLGFRYERLEEKISIWVQLINQLKAEKISLQYLLDKSKECK